MAAGDTPLSVVNRALTEIAARQPITGSLPSFGGSAAGVAAGQLYQAAVNTLLRQEDFEFARATTALMLTGNPAPLNWSYEYYYPSDCMRVRQIVPETWDQYNPLPTLWTVGDAFVAGHLAESSVTVTGIGSQYQPGDTGILDGGVQPANYLVLTTGTGGTVLTATLTSGGAGYSAGLASTTPGGQQPGAGSGLTFTITYAYTASYQVIWTNEVGAELVYSSNNVTPGQWDALFTEQMVRYLGSMLAMPVGGRPDFSREMLGQAGGLGQAGRDRDS